MANYRKYGLSAAVAKPTVAYGSGEYVPVDMQVSSLLCQKVEGRSATNFRTRRFEGLNLHGKLKAGIRGVELEDCTADEVSSGNNNKSVISANRCEIKKLDI